MVEERFQGRFAAILAADVVGFSRMMEVDEAGTLATLKARRTGVRGPLVAKRRVFKVAGDRILFEFISGRRSRLFGANQAKVSRQRGSP